MKLLEHFNAMQEMASRYLEPSGGYTDLEGREFRGQTRKGEATGFISDMIYMLDGPEQREAQIEAQNLFTDTGFHLPSVNEGLRLARVCNGYPLQGDLPDDEVVVRFKLNPDWTREELVGILVKTMTEERPGVLAELEVDDVVHLNV